MDYVPHGLRAVAVFVLRTEPFARHSVTSATAPAWALEELGGTEARKALTRALDQEHDRQVREDIRTATDFRHIDEQGGIRYAV